MIIYKITNLTNGKMYVGQTVRDIDTRIAEHKRKRNSIVSQAIKKYGKENFMIEVIDECDNIDDLNRKEIEWIQHYGCVVPFGYNQCYGGNNTMGYNHKEESKKKMSKSKEDVFLGEENPFFGKTHSVEQKAKWSKERKGRDMTKVTEASFEKTRKKIINLDTEEIFNSIQEAADKYNIKNTHLSRVCRGGRKRTGGFRWMYYDEYKKQTS